MILSCDDVMIFSTFRRIYRVYMNMPLEDTQRQNEEFYFINQKIDLAG